MTVGIYAPNRKILVRELEQMHYFLTHIALEATLRDKRNVVCLPPVLKIKLECDCRWEMESLDEVPEESVSCPHSNWFIMYEDHVVNYLAIAQEKKETTLAVPERPIQP